MKKNFSLRSFAAVIITLVLSINTGLAQQSAVDHMSGISSHNQDITNQFISYTSSVAHGKSARKVEKNRKALIKTVDEARTKVKKMSGFEGDNSLQAAAVEYLEICYNILNNDYEKIVNMEEIAEQSYDNMEAYLMAQDQADEKLNNAADKLNGVQKQFAEKHSITLIDKETENSKKLEKIGKVNDYYHEIFLIFFKSAKQSAYLTVAIDEKNINSIEQNRTTLLKYAEEGLAKLEALKPFENDATILNAAKKMLTFYKEQAEKHVPVITDFHMKNERFEEIKKSVENNSKRSQEEVDKYNAAANDINKAGEKFNKTIQDMNNKNAQLTEAWNNAVKNFLDKHMPHA